MNQLMRKFLEPDNTDAVMVLESEGEYGSVDFYLTSYDCRICLTFDTDSEDKRYKALERVHILKEAIRVVEEAIERVQKS